MDFSIIGGSSGTEFKQFPMLHNCYNIIVLIPQKYEEVEILPFALNLIKVNQME